MFWEHADEERQHAKVNDRTMQETGFFVVKMYFINKNKALDKSIFSEVIDHRSQQTQLMG